MKNDRLFQLIYLLLEHGSMTAPELSSRLEVAVRTVYRDVETLSAAGVPIYATAGKGGGISLMPGYSFDKTLLSGKEQDQLLFAVQSLQAADQQVGELLHKLGAAFQKPRVDWIAVEFSRWGMRQTDTKRFELLKAAILDRQVLKIAYCGASGEKSERLIHPLRLIYKDKSWYLQGYCLKADDFRLFKISRILETTLTGTLFAQSHTADIPPIEISTPTVLGTRIKLRFSPQIAYRVYDEFEHSEIVQEPNGYFVTEVNFPLDNWVVGYLFSFGTDVEILQPAYLKEQLVAYSEKITAHHRT